MRSRHHTRPSGRRGLAAAYAEVQREVTALRTTVRLDSYEVVRLGAVVAALQAEIRRLSVELATVRGEIAAIRAGGQTDPLVQLLATQAAELRDQLASTELTVADLRLRLVAASMAQPPTPAAPPSSSVATPTRTVVPATKPVAPPRPVMPAAPIMSGSPAFDELRRERPALSGLIGSSSLPGAPNPNTPEGDLDETLPDFVDLTAERLRLIRASLDA